MYYRTTLTQTRTRLGPDKPSDYQIWTSPRHKILAGSHFTFCELHLRLMVSICDDPNCIYGLLSLTFTNC